MRIRSLTSPLGIWWGKGREAYLSFRHQVDSSFLLPDCLQNVKANLCYFSLKASGATISRSTRKLRGEEHCWVYESKKPWVFAVIVEASNLWDENHSGRHCKMQLQWARTWLSASFNLWLAIQIRLWTEWDKVSDEFILLRYSSMVKQTRQKLTKLQFHSEACNNNNNFDKAEWGER